MGVSKADVVVVGAGAAGLVAAIFAGRSGGRVRVLESTPDGGKKILISGGGRCNVLPSELDPADYVTASSPHTLRKMLLSWPLGEQRSFFENELGIRLALESESGKLFPASNRSRDVRDALVRACGEEGCEFHFGSAATSLEPLGGGGWAIGTAAGRFECDAVILATGGLSVPKTGSDGTGLRLLRHLGHTVNETYPALTPLTRTPAVHADLAGVSLEVSVRATPPNGPLESAAGFLFTHRGYSGPAVLNVSHAAVRAEPGDGQRLLVRWGRMAAGEWEALLTDGGCGSVAGVVRRHLPSRLADRLVEESGVDGQRPVSQLRREERLAVVSTLTDYPLVWTGHEGYKKAEVTGGGLALGEVHPKTLESKLHRGLFVCGELLDAFGPIGGYNFAWAWATGRAAGRGATSAIRPTSMNTGELDG